MEALPDYPQQLELDISPLGDRWIKTPQQHAATMHEEGKGVVYVARSGREGAFHQKPYPVEVAVEVARYYAEQQNVFLTSQRFRGARTLTDLLSLSSLFADVDFYKVERYENWHPFMVFEEACNLLQRAGIPEPTVAIGTGRGLSLMWLHEPVKRSALPRWQACQRYIWAALRSLGADNFAKDAARFMRLVGTKNRRGRGDGRQVEALTPVGETFAFNDLAEKILPFTQAEIRNMAIERAKREGKRPSEARQRTPTGFNTGTLLEARLTDFQTFRRRHWFGPLPPGNRNNWMLLAGSAVAYLVDPICPQLVTRELHRLAKDAVGPEWRDREVQHHMHGVIKRTRMAANGVKVEYDGKLWDPRYMWRNDTIIELLGITPEDERHMLTIISDNERRRRDREKKEKLRREAGMVNRDAQARERRRRARKLRSEGKTRREVAEALGVSERQVKRIWKEGGT